MSSAWCDAVTAFVVTAPWRQSDPTAPGSGDAGSRSGLPHSRVRDTCHLFSCLLDAAGAPEVAPEDDGAVPPSGRRSIPVDLLQPLRDAVPTPPVPHYSGTGRVTPKSRRAAVPLLRWEDSLWVFCLHWGSYLCRRRATVDHEADPTAAADRLLQPWLPLLPPPVTVWRQPALLSALVTLAADLWAVQLFVHPQGVQRSTTGTPHEWAAAEEAENARRPVRKLVVSCPVCEAAARDDTVALDALLTLLQLHRVCAASIDSLWHAQGVAAATTPILDPGTQEAFRTHAVAAGRVALWNGAGFTLQHLTYHWVLDGRTADLFGWPPFHASSSAAATFRSCQHAWCHGDPLHMWLRLLWTLWMQDEAAAQPMDTADEGHSPRSASTYHRGEAETLASYRALRQVLRPPPAGGTADDELFLVDVTAMRLSDRQLWCTLMLDTPQPTLGAVAGDGGATFLTWLCGRGYQRVVRELLMDVRRMCGPSSTASAIVAAAVTGQAVVVKPGAGEEGIRRVSFPMSSGPSPLPASRGASAAERTSVAYCPRFERPTHHRYTALDAALQRDDAALMRQLLLGGASVYPISPLVLRMVQRRHMDTPGNSERGARLAALLADPGRVLDPPQPDMLARLRTSLCRSAAADTLADLALRLWCDKVKHSPKTPAPVPPHDGDLSFRRVWEEWWRAHHAGQDRVLRPALASLGHDPHHPAARVVLLRVLSRKIHEYGTLLHPQEAVMDPDLVMTIRKYYAAVHRMQQQLSHSLSMLRLQEAVRARCEVLEWQHTHRPFASSGANAQAATLAAESHAAVQDIASLRALMKDILRSLPTTQSQSGNTPRLTFEAAYTADAPSSAPAYVLVHLPPPVLPQTLGVDLHPKEWLAVWLRLPPWLDLSRSLTAGGGAYGLVEGPMPLSSPLQQGDLIAFTSQKHADVNTVSAPSSNLGEGQRHGLVATEVITADSAAVMEFHVVFRGEEALRRVRLYCVLESTSTMLDALPTEGGGLAAPWEPLRWLQVQCPPPGVHRGGGAAPPIAFTPDIIGVLCSPSDGFSPAHQQWNRMVDGGAQPRWLREVLPPTGHEAAEEEEEGGDPDELFAVQDGYLSNDMSCVWRSGAASSGEGCRPTFRLAVQDFPTLREDTQPHERRCDSVDDDDVVYILSQAETPPDFLDTTTAEPLPLSHTPRAGAWQVEGVVPRWWGWTARHHRWT